MGGGSGRGSGREGGGVLLTELDVGPVDGEISNVSEPDHDRLPGLEVPEPQREHVAPVLLKQLRPMALPGRQGELLLCGRLACDLAHRDHPVDVDLEAADRGLAVEREEVAALGGAKELVDVPARVAGWRCWIICGMGARLCTF